MPFPPQVVLTTNLPPSIFGQMMTLGLGREAVVVPPPDEDPFNSDRFWPSKALTYVTFIPQ